MSLRSWFVACLSGIALAGAGCQPGSQQQQQSSEPLLGLADYHNHQFGYLGFGGTLITHSIDPATGCRPVPSFDRNSLAVKDIVRGQLFARAGEQWALGQCVPSIGNMASQRVDTENLKRAWQYGLRLIVMFALSSEFLCEVGDFANPCPSDRSAMEQQIQAAKDLEASIDSASGGPGTGWYRIVRSPAEARQVVAAGKLAVVLGIEGASAFGCRVSARSRVVGIAILPTDEPNQETTYDRDCDDGTIGLPAFYTHTSPDEDLNTYGKELTHKALALFEHYWDLGVRHFYLAHNIDGLAAGTAISIDPLHGERDPSGAGVESVNRVARAIRPSFTTTDCSSRIPYDGGRCNAKGLEELGRELARLMGAHGAIIDADHISLKAKRELLANDGLFGGVYPLISSHSGADTLVLNNASNEGQLVREDVDQIIRTGGSFAPRLPPVVKKGELATYPAGTTVAPHECGGTSESFVQTYRYLVDKLRAGKLINGSPAFVGIGIGTDLGAPVPVFGEARFRKAEVLTGEVVEPGRNWLLNQLSSLSGSSGTVRGCYNTGSANPMVSYPFTSTSPLSRGTQFEKSTTPWDGRATQPGYDVAYDGVVHVGMLPDFVEEMAALGLTSDDLLPLFHGAEAYIRTWEVAEAWKQSFDSEGTKGIRATCEAARKALLDSEDRGDAAAVVSAMRDLRSNRCRAIP